MGSSSIDLSYVSGGRHGLFLQAECCDWDWYPGVSLVTAAGGATEVFTHVGTRWHLAGNRVAVAECKAALLSS